MAAPSGDARQRVRRGLRVGVVALACALAGPALLIPDPGVPVTSPAPERGVTVDGAQLLRDGEPWIPRGFNMIGLLTPAWCDQPTGIAAREHFGADELAAARNWGADALRFQVSQRGLADPAVAADDRAAYLASVLDGVAQARAAGFAVIVSMQDQTYGCGDVHPQPSAETADAWRVLAPELADDPDLLLELFNEPRNEADAAGWAQWRDGGSSPDANLGDPAIGHQALVDLLRALGSANVLVADAARLGERSTGLPRLDDPLERVAYAIHPYYFQPGEPWWDEHYGDLAVDVPVLATEWNYLAAECGTEAERLAPRLLGYLAEHGIGVFGHAFDIPTRTVADWNWTPTRCGGVVGGSGAVLRDHFRSQARGDG